MGQQTCFHAPNGTAEFLGLRQARGGAREIVYDNGTERRLVLRLSGADVGEAMISDVLRMSVAARRVVPTLFCELSKRAIAIEIIRA